MCKYTTYKRLGVIAVMALAWPACKAPVLTTREANNKVPDSYATTGDTTSSAAMPWNTFFTDPHLRALIDTALKNNQELNITLQEIAITRNEINARKGEYLPFVGLKAGAGIDKVGRYTSQGAGDATTEIKPGKEMPEPLPDFLIGAYANWELDVWHKLRNATKASVNRYLATAEGRNFVITNLIAEIANSYYELLALDNQLAVVKQNSAIQQNALDIVKAQKQAARATELAVRKFEAEVLNTQSLQFGIQQQITETENRINFLLGRFPQPIPRDAQAFNKEMLAPVHAGLPAQLLANRPDIRQAELEIAASKLDVQVARAQFLPSIGISASLGYNAFSPGLLFKTPESLLYSLAGDLMAPLVNRNAIKAAYYNANAKQTQAIFQYERTILNAYIEVANQLSNIGNLEKSYDLKAKQVEALTQSINISGDLFKSARADYMEVLMTQRDALESKFELLETQKQQMNALVNIYRALGGGWK